MHRRSNRPPRGNDVPARRAAAVLFAGLVLGAACSAPTEPVPVAPGRSDRPPGGATVPASSAAPAPTRWERWPEVAAYRVAVPRAASQHLAGDHEAETLASPEAAAYPDLGPARAIPPGSALIQRLYAPGAAAPEVLFAMVRPPSSPASPSPAVSPATDTASTAPPGMTPAAPDVLAAQPWEFLVLSPDGMVQERGPIELCARCHAEAPHDGLFGRAQ